MPRFLFTPDDFSPTYDLESDGQRGFVQIHAIFDIHPNYDDAQMIPIEQHYIDYISGPGWAKVLAHRDFMKQET